MMTAFRAPASLLASSTLLIVVAAAAIVEAQPIQSETPKITLTGEVTAVDAKAGTISVQGANGEKGVFLVDDKSTTIMSGSQKVALSALAKGDWLAIDGDMKDGKKVATYIEVVEEASGGDEASPALATRVGAKIEIRHNQLSPDLVQISAGHSVTFHNVDKMPGGHTIEAADGAFSSPALDRGQDWSHSFDVPGMYKVRIKQHPSAEATIVVEAAK